MSILPAAKPRRRQDFTLTMINIVFLLLLFFLTTGSLTNSDEAQTTVPSTETLPMEKLPRPLLLIGKDGRLSLDGTPVAADGMGPTIKARLDSQGIAPALNVLADRAMPATHFLDMVDRLRAVGIEVRIVTTRSRGQPG
jgi:biopolymer transport protein ExbD